MASSAGCIELLGFGSRGSFITLLGMCMFSAPARVLVLVQMADTAGVDVGPVEVQPGVLVVPLLSWYNTAFDTEDPR
jgi:hypothetical protein